MKQNVAHSATKCPSHFFEKIKSKYTEGRKGDSVLDAGHGTHLFMLQLTGKILNPKSIKENNNT